jgi:LacI family transcriptional regulator
MAKLTEVAARAGVSPATVSRVLSGASSVTPAYRERVLQAVTELEYRPNRLASNLRRQKTETIGVVVSDIENPHFTEMVRTVESAAFRRGYRVILCNTDETIEKQQAYLEVLAEEQVAGIILVPSDPAGAEIARLLAVGVPIVAFDRRVADPRADAVVIDNAGGGRRATEYLLQAGHERIGFVGGRADIQTGAERLAGYEAAMTEQGLLPRAASGAFRIDEGMAATEELLSADDAPITALVVANNLMTIGALRALRARGLHVPEDVGLVAIDDPFWAELVDPPLTTLAQPIQQMAESAVELLFNRIESGGRTQTTCLMFSFALRARGSCGVQG